MTKEKVVGIYGDANSVATDPGYLDFLQGEIGLNRVIFGGGFNLSARTRGLNPSTGNASPGITLVDDDTAIRRSLKEANKRGITAWGCISTYWAGAEHAPELMAYDLYGKRMDEYPLRTYAHEQGSMTFCPNNERINDWFEGMLVEIATQYDFQGYALTHCRYCHPAFFEQMLGCACPVCQKKASEWGYDFPRMKAAVLRTIEAIKGLSADKSKAIAATQFGFFDFLQVLGVDAGGVVDWFNFRADGITNNLKRFKAAIKSTRPDFIFGSDSHYPTMALLVGHRYSDLASVCDQILPLLSHNEIHFMDNVGSFATILREWVAGLEEADAIRLVYNLLGIRTLMMPETIQAMNLGNPPTSESSMPALQGLIENEMRKARLMSGEEVASYPVIKGSVWPEQTIRCLMEISLETGHDGIVFQGTDSLFTYKK
jgi:hypothetical protein